MSKSQNRQKFPIYPLTHKEKQKKYGTWKSGTPQWSEEDICEDLPVSELK